ncbi:hypothetical protein DY000_02040477 [Brassica cretica]|uniref:Uncharacterized protein n=1 Tax=Brassica cretica TaxID=69181 RepID=A0ABQ7B852_BRACR|nr:hypothetical protein DY000_02040477 [Brassica cretica]
MSLARRLQQWYGDVASCFEDEVIVQNEGKEEEIRLCFWKIIKVKEDIFFPIDKAKRLPTLMTKMAKETVVACIQLKDVFCRKFRTLTMLPSGMSSVGQNRERWNHDPPLANKLWMQRAFPLMMMMNLRVSVWTGGERQRVSSMSEEQFSYETQLMMLGEQFSYEDK